MDKLYLIGTDRHDIDGKERLDALLNKLSPKKIILGFGQDVAKIFSEKEKYFPKDPIESIAEGLLENGNSANQIKNLISAHELFYSMIGYDFQSAREYSDRAKAKIEYIDGFIDKNEKLAWIHSLEVYPMNRIYSMMCMEPVMDSLETGLEEYLTNSKKHYTDYSYGPLAGFLEYYSKPENKNINAMMDPQAKKIQYHRLQQALNICDSAANKTMQRFLGKSIVDRFKGEDTVFVFDFNQIYHIAEIAKKANPQVLMLNSVL